MNTLLELSWRGALMTVAVVSFDRLFAARINVRARRVWWLLVPLAFLVTIPLPVLPASKYAAFGSIHPLETVALAVDATTRPVERPAIGAPPEMPSASVVLIIALGGSSLYLLVVLARTCSALQRWSHVPLCTDPELLRALEECKAKAGITIPVGLAVSERVSAPLILGWLRPRILLPSALVNSLSDEQLRGVLFHELAHLRSHDVPCAFLFTLVCALHWFNPAAHFALRAWAQFREEAADEAAIAWLGPSSNLTYGETLLHVLRAANGPRQTSLAALAIVESVSQLRKRLIMIKRHSSKQSHCVLSSAAFFIIASGILLRPVRAAEAPLGGEISIAPASSTPTSEPSAAQLPVQAASAVTPGLPANASAASSPSIPADAKATLPTQPGAGLNRLEAAAIPKTQDFESGEKKLDEVSAESLECFLQDLNQRKDWDYACHNGQPGPDAAYLFKWVVRTTSELQSRGYYFAAGQLHRPGTVVPVR